VWCRLRSCFNSFLSYLRFISKFISLLHKTESMYSFCKAFSAIWNIKTVLYVVCCWSKVFFWLVVVTVKVIISSFVTVQVDVRHVAQVFHWEAERCWTLSAVVWHFTASRTVISTAECRQKQPFTLDVMSLVCDAWCSNIVADLLAGIQNLQVECRPT